MIRMRRLLTRPWVIIVLTAGLAAVAAGLYWFQPWKLWVNETVQEELPPAAAAQPSSPAPVPSTPAQAPGTSAASAPREKPAGPALLATGELISHEHATSGSVRILRAADGSLVLRLENLDTSNGPDLRVWITDAPVLPGRDGWGVFDDGKYVSAGKLKGNKGSQNYALPAGFDLAAYKSVSIWCDRFNVSFGAAELAKTAQPA